MKVLRQAWIIAATGALITLGLACGQPTDQRQGPWKGVPDRSKMDHYDHTPLFTKDFKSGPEVTAECLKCHKESGEEMLKSEHWLWLGDEVKIPGHGDKKVRIGKKNIFNNFCIGVQGNWPACTTCHAGYGWKDKTFDFKNPNNIDCLVCHDTTGDYRKKGGTGGMPELDVNLKKVAQKVGLPGRANCGTCHFRGGGGNAVKHGDLADSLMHPNSRLDVHMGKNNMVCTDCHKTQHHKIPGRAISVGVTDENRVNCIDCHDAKPHSDNRLNAHAERLACQTCHIPHMGDKDGTKMEWYWSEAGDGAREKKIDNKHAYMKIKGRFVWKYGAKPEYTWWNGTASRYMPGDKMDPDTVTKIAYPLGDRKDAKAKIWPFKIHRGNQPYDKVNKILLNPNTFGPDGYWTKFDWDLALKNGSKITGLPFSGEYGFANTEMYWPLSHMVQSKDRALSCQQCHSEGGRMDWKALGYDADPALGETFEHDAITLKDADGNAVIDSGRPMSNTQTCGECHELDDKDFLQAHIYHKNIDLKKLSPERRAQMVNGPRFDQDIEKTDCLLCHLNGADNKARLQAITSGKADWSRSVTMLDTGVLAASAGSYHWVKDKFDAEEKSVELPIGPARSENCGACHGLVAQGENPVFFELDGKQGKQTLMTGNVFSGQIVRNSGLNLTDKDDQYGPWDVHAQRMVGCGDCHYNNKLPERFVKEGKKGLTPVKAGERRTCTSCHEPNTGHEWLISQSMHFDRLSCESCHIPHVNAAAAESIDHTVMRDNGQPLISYRGLDKNSKASDKLPLMSGYTPALMRDTTGKIRPFNLQSIWQWVAGDKQQPVPEAALHQAWLKGGHYRPEIISAFDANKDGQLDDMELRLNKPAKVALIAKNLAAAGQKNVKIIGEIKGLRLHHGVATGHFARKQCTDCHSQKGQPKLRQRDLVELSPYVPAGAEAKALTVGHHAVFGKVVKGKDGSLNLRPQMHE